MTAEHVRQSSNTNTSMIYSHTRNLNDTDKRMLEIFTFHVRHVAMRLFWLYRETYRHKCSSLVIFDIHRSCHHCFALDGDDSEFENVTEPVPRHCCFVTALFSYITSPIVTVVDEPETLITFLDPT